MDNIAYKKYIDEHIDNVNMVWEGLQPLLKGEFWLDDCTWDIIDTHVRFHDKSKYDSEEFGGYCQWFYPTDLDVKIESSFDLAWNHHQKHNSHHWEYWLMSKDNRIIPLEIPFDYIIEMLCDWSAMSVKFGDTPQEFYDKTKNKIILTELTRSCVERWLPLFVQTVKVICHAKGELT